MLVRDMRALGRLIRDRRRKQGWSQARLGERIGASRFWVADVEKGKPTVEAGLVLSALRALDLEIAVHTAGVEGFPLRSAATARVQREGAAHGRTGLTRGGQPLDAVRRITRGRDGR
jgi:transcriptional regulator with XRE-family HTH domain